MFNLFRKNEKQTWENYSEEQIEEIIDGKLILTIGKNTTVEDLNDSIVKYMKDNGMDKKYKLTISKIDYYPPFKGS